MNLSEAILMALALSADAFAMSFSYGVNFTKINKYSNLIISIMCTLMLGISLYISDIVNQFIPPDISKIASFLILFILGLYKLFQNNSNSIIRTLKLRESILVGFSMSIDSMVVGITGAEGTSKLVILAIVFIVSVFAILFGNYLGYKLSEVTKIDISKLGAIIIIVLAFLKLS